MNKDILEGKWKQIRGEAKAWWGKLTDDDLDRGAGNSEQLIGVGPLSNVIARRVDKVRRIGPACLAA